MPLLSLTTTSTAASDERRLLAELSRLVAEQLGKPESYVMTALEHPAHMTFGGTHEPACYVELKNIGRFTPELTRRLSAELCSRLSAAFGVPPNRIYIEFSDAEPHRWGYDGDTFA